VSVRVSLLSLLDKDPAKFILLFGARQRLSKHVPTATNARNNRRSVGCVCRYVCLSVYPPIVGRLKLGEDVPAAKNFWSRRYMCGPYHIKGN
jgi:hypothetical protein